MRRLLWVVPMLVIAAVAAATPVSAGPGAPVRTPIVSAFPQPQDPWRSWGVPHDPWSRSGVPHEHFHDHGFVVKHRAPVWVPSQWVWDGATWVWWPGRWVR